MPEEYPDEAEGGDDLIGVDFFAFPVGGSFLGRLELDRLAFYDDGLHRFRFVEEPQGVVPVIAGYRDTFVQDV
jgi:hypothetical protein